MRRLVEEGLWRLVGDGLGLSEKILVQGPAGRQRLRCAKEIDEWTLDA